MPAESELQATIVQWLRADGWLTISFAWHRKMPKSLVGHPDIAAHKHDVTLYVETKAPRGGRTPAQTAFYLALRPHLGPHLRYVLAYSLAAVQMQLQWGHNAALAQEDEEGRCAYRLQP